MNNINLIRIDMDYNNIDRQTSKKRQEKKIPQ